MDDFVGTSSDEAPPPGPEEGGAAVDQGTPPTPLSLTAEDMQKLGVDPTTLQVGSEYKVTMHLRLSGVQSSDGDLGGDPSAPPAAPGGASADFDILKMEGFSDAGEQHSPGAAGVAEEASEDDASPDEAESPEDDEKDQEASKTLGFDFGAMRKAKAKRPVPKVSAKELE